MPRLTPKWTSAPGTEYRPSGSCAGSTDSTCGVEADADRIQDCMAVYNCIPSDRVYCPVCPDNEAAPYYNVTIDGLATNGDGYPDCTSINGTKPLAWLEPDPDSPWGYGCGLWGWEMVDIYESPGGPELDVTYSHRYNLFFIFLDNGRWKLMFQMVIDYLYLGNTYESGHVVYESREFSATERCDTTGDVTLHHVRSWNAAFTTDDDPYECANWRDLTITVSPTNG